MQRYGLNVVTPPAEEPLSLAEAKHHLRVDSALDDDYIASLIVAARRWAELANNRTFVATIYDLSLDTFPAGGWIEFPRPPLQSVASVTYFDAAGTPTVWPPSNYQVDAAAFIGRLLPVYGVTWPSFTARPAAAVVVRFTAGYGAAADVPEEIKSQLKLLIGHLYENREETVSASVGNKLIAFGIDALMIERVITF